MVVVVVLDGARAGVTVCRVSGTAGVVGVGGTGARRVRGVEVGVGGAFGMGSSFSFRVRLAGGIVDA